MSLRVTALRPFIQKVLPPLPPALLPSLPPLAVVEWSLYRYDSHYNQSFAVVQELVISTSSHNPEI